MQSLMQSLRSLRAAVAALAVGVLLAVPALADGTAKLHVGEAWARAPVGPARTTAAFFSLTNTGDGDARLVAAETAAAETVELHRTTMADGVMKMRPVEAIAVPAGGTTVLRPGGLHVMLIGAAGLAPGDTLALTLRFERAPAISLDVPVLPPGERPESFGD